MTNNTKKLKEIDFVDTLMTYNLAYYDTVDGAYKRVLPQDKSLIQKALKHLRESVEAMGESELKPCPFCGGEPDFQKGYRRGVGYVCTDIDCPDWDFKDTKEEAIKAWNTRATGDTLKQFMEE